MSRQEVRTTTCVCCKTEREKARFKGSIVQLSLTISDPLMAGLVQGAGEGGGRGEGGKDLVRWEGHPLKGEDSGKYLWTSCDTVDGRRFHLRVDSVVWALVSGIGKSFMQPCKVSKLRLGL